MKDVLEKILLEIAGEPMEVQPQPKEEFGHFTSTSAMRIAKEKNEDPKKVAEEIINKLEEKAPRGLFDGLAVAGPGFINMWLSKEVIREHFGRIMDDKHFGRNDSGGGENVIVEFSSPNMAKEMHAGHLRNNSIGEALSRIHDANGYRVIRWNYVGDWGTQFGIIIAAYKKWGKDLDLNHTPIKHLEELYVRFNQEAKDNPDMAEVGRQEFKKLEEGDEENRDIWNRFRTASLQEIEKFYRRFDIRFDEYVGESFFEEMVKVVIKRLLEKGFAEFSEGAVVVHLDQFGLPPGMIQKTDGTSLYLSRDVAALEYRVENYHPKKLLYVVGNEQTLSFQQLFAIAGILGMDHGVELQHVKYGLLLGGDGKKMSTRQGTSIPASALAEEAVERVRKIVNEKNPDMSPGEQMEIAEIVAIGALKYFMLKENRFSDITFDWERILDFKGDSGPYLLYTYARLRRILDKAGHFSGKVDLDHLGTDHEMRLMRKMFDLPQEVKRSAEGLMTNNLSTYLYELANLANRFYEDEPIVTDENSSRRHARLALVTATTHILERGLDLLGIEVSDSI